MNYIRYSFLISLIGLSFFSLSCLKASSDEEEDNDQEDPQEIFYDSPIPHVMGHALSTIIKVALQKKVINPYLEPYKKNRFIAFINNHSESLLEVAEGFLLQAIRRYNTSMPNEQCIAWHCFTNGMTQAYRILGQEMIVIISSAIVARITKKYHHSSYYVYGTRVLRALARIGIQSAFISYVWKKFLLAPGTLSHRRFYQQKESSICTVHLDTVRCILEKHILEETYDTTTKTTDFLLNQ